MSIQWFPNRLSNWRYCRSPNVRVIGWVCRCLRGMLPPGQYSFPSKIVASGVVFCYVLRTFFAPRLHLVIGLVRSLAWIGALSDPDAKGIHGIPFTIKYCSDFDCCVSRFARHTWWDASVVSRTTWFSWAAVAVVGVGGWDFGWKMPETKHIRSNKILLFVIYYCYYYYYYYYIFYYIYMHIYAVILFIYLYYIYILHPWNLTKQESVLAPTY